MYGSDPFNYDFETALAATETKPRSLTQAERQARWDAGLSLDGRTKLDPAIARYLARRGARPDAKPKIIWMHTPEPEQPFPPVTARKLERHISLYGKDGTEGIEVVDEGRDMRERPLPADWKSRRLRCIRRDKNICQRCNAQLGTRQLSAHHIVPRTEGGSDDLSNLITLCLVSRRANGGLSCHDYIETRWRRFPNAPSIVGSLAGDA